LKTDICQETFGKRHLARDIWQETFGKRHLARDIWQEIFGKRHLARDIWYTYIWRVFCQLTSGRQTLDLQIFEQTDFWPPQCSVNQMWPWPGKTKGGYHCTVDLLFDWFGISCMTTDNFCFYLQNRLIWTGQTGSHWYSDTSPFIIPCHNIRSTDNWQTIIFYPVDQMSLDRLVFDQKTKYPLVTPPILMVFASKNFPTFFRSFSIQFYSNPFSHYNLHLSAIS
jgi:hypothetical protein